MSIEGMNDMVAFPNKPVVRGANTDVRRHGMAVNSVSVVQRNPYFISGCLGGEFVPTIQHFPVKFQLLRPSS